MNAVANPAGCGRATGGPGTIRSVRYFLSRSSDCEIRLAWGAARARRNSTITMIATTISKAPPRKRNFQPLTAASPGTTTAVCAGGSGLAAGFAGGSTRSGTAAGTLFVTTGGVSRTDAVFCGGSVAGRGMSALATDGTGAGAGSDATAGAAVFGSGAGGGASWGAGRVAGWDTTGGGTDGGG